MQTISYELSEIQEAAAQVIRWAGEETIWVLQGQMGAGKTTLVKAIGHVLGVTDEVSSPTFGIVNEYTSGKGQSIYHFDFYRMDDPTEALDIGIEEYFYSGSICLIEWAEKIAQFIPDEFLLIKIEILSEHSRKIHLQKIQNGA